MLEAVLSFIGVALSVLVGWRISRSARSSGQRQAELGFAPKAWARIDALEARLVVTQKALRDSQMALADASAELGDASTELLDLRTYYRDAIERLVVAGAFIDELGQTFVDAGVQLPKVPEFPEALQRIADGRVWRAVQNKGKR